MEDWESRPDLPPMADGSARPAAERQGALLFAAREFLESNAAAALCADVERPVDPIWMSEWKEWGDG